LVEAPELMMAWDLAKRGRLGRNVTKFGDTKWLYEIACSRMMPTMQDMDYKPGNF